MEEIACELSKEENIILKDLLQRVRKSGKANAKFDLNLSEGKQAESELMGLLSNSSVEVKREFSLSKTGNVAVEFMARGKPSGISVSEADWWAYVLDGDKYHGEVVVLIKKNRLERLLLPARTVRGGDRDGKGIGQAEMFLVRVEELVKPLTGVS